MYVHFLYKQKEVRIKGVIFDQQTFFLFCFKPHFAQRNISNKDLLMLNVATK